MAVKRKAVIYRHGLNKATKTDPNEGKAGYKQCPKCKTFRPHNDREGFIKHKTSGGKNAINCSLIGSPEIVAQIVEMRTRRESIRTIADTMGMSIGKVTMIIDANMAILEGR